MKAVITGEGDGIVGVNLRDNGGAEHLIEMNQTGEITGHEQDGYPDKAAKRTPENNEYVEQARKYARYYVYVHRGYDTVPPESHPERINAVRLVMKDLTDAEFEKLFGDFYRQMRSYHDYDTERPIPEPPNASENVLYRQNVYLGINPLDTDIAAEAEGLATAHDVDLSDESILGESVDGLSDAVITSWQAFADDLVGLAKDKDVSLADGAYIDAVSSLYATYLDDAGEQYTTDPSKDPFEREPDTVIELPPIDPQSMDDFRAYLDHHLKCQIRDCFVRMGVHPPDPFRVLGNGQLESVAAYKLLDMYPELYDPETDTLQT